MIYIASKTKYASWWRKLRAEGVPIISTWIDEEVDKSGKSVNLKDLWIRCVSEARTASALILYYEEDDVLKGALVEVGAALANFVPVYLVGPVISGSWVHHPCVKLHTTNIEEALEAIENS